MKPMIFYSMFSLISLTCLFIYLIGIFNFLSDQQHPERCEMTYMYEYPQYVRIFQKSDSNFPKYALYAYAEGGATKRARNGTFDGIPVLFIPGNAGSHQQVRSLASIALRISLNSKTPNHFDYFTVDLNGEFSAFYGVVLYDQVNFVLDSIERILELYKSKTSSSLPKKVILVGHSVGGVIGKKVLQLQEEFFKKNLVDLLITLAAPVQRGHVYLDIHSTYLYETNDLSENYMLVNIAGGYTDLLIPTYLSGIQNYSNNLNVVVSESCKLLIVDLPTYIGTKASQIPKAWLETNHVQIVWCKQLLMALNRALFDSIDMKTLQLSNNLNFLNKVFTHHLIHNSGTIQHLLPGYSNISKIDTHGEWIENINRQFTLYYKTGLKSPHWYMLAFTALPNYEMLTILAVNLEVTDWIYACNAAHPTSNGRICVEAENLTPQSEIAFSSRYKRRFITIHMHELKKRRPNYTHVIFKAMPTREPIQFHIDVYGSNERKMEVSLPILTLTKQKILDKTPDKAVVYNLILPELTHLVQSYLLFVEPKECPNKHYATASLIVPWANENMHSAISEMSNEPLKVRIQHSKPFDASDAFVRLVLDPMCTYEISVKQDIFGVFGQLARYYSITIFAYIVLIYLLTLDYQFFVLETTGKFPLFPSSIFSSVKDIWLFFTSAIFVTFFITYPHLGEVVVPPETLLISYNSILGDSIVIPFFLYLVSFAILLLLALLFIVSIFTMESTINSLILRFFTKCAPVFEQLADAFPDIFIFYVNSLQRVPIVVSISLIILCFVLCGGIGLCAGAVYYFLKLSQMSHDWIEEAIWDCLKKIWMKMKALNILSWVRQRFNRNTENDDSREINLPVEIDRNPKHNALFFHFTMFFLWILITFLNIPSILAWQHNIRYSITLQNDTSLFSALILCLCGMPLWHFNLPKTNRKHTNLLRTTFTIFAFIGLTYGQVSWYRINILLTLLFALITIHQCYPFRFLQEHQAHQD